MRYTDRDIDAALMYVAARPGLTTRSFREAHGLSAYQPDSMTGLIGRLRRRGLVDLSREPGATIALTERGRERVADLRAAMGPWAVG